MKATTIKNYLIQNYGECRHDHVKIAKSLKHVSKKHGVSIEDLFHLVFENRPIDGAYTHSYGFQTANGRELVNSFSNTYYSI